MSQVSETGPTNVPAANSAVSPGKIRLLVLTTLISYGNSLTAPFIFDDYKWIVEQPLVRDLFFFLVLAPGSSIIAIKDMAVEHRIDIPLAAVTAVVVLLWFGFTEWLVKDPVARRLGLGSTATLAVLILVGLTVQRNADYCDPLRMWSKVVEVASHNPRGHFSLGATYNLRGNGRLAKAHFERAIAFLTDTLEAYPKR